MTDLPRLTVTVTQEQVRHIKSTAVDEQGNTTVLLRLPERPTMPCPTCEGSRSVGEPGYTYCGIPEPGSYEACPDCMDDHGIPDGFVPIPEGTRVEVGWVELSPSANPNDWLDDPWRPVATATVASVSKHTTFNMDGDTLAWEWIITLTDINPVEAP